MYLTCEQNLTNGQLSLPKNYKEIKNKTKIGEQRNLKSHEVCEVVLAARKIQTAISILVKHNSLHCSPSTFRCALVKLS